MRFDLTPEEARPAALAAARLLKKRGMTLRVEKAAWPDAPYRTTLVATQAGRTVLVEAQGAPSLGRSLKDLNAWIASRRLYAELYIVTTADAHIQAGVLAELADEGVGLLVVDEKGVVSEQRRARNPALVITPEPTLRLGPARGEVVAAVEKFNTGERKDGLRDMCECVERLTEEVGVRACKRGWLKVPEGQFKAKDWSGQINELARPEAYNAPHGPLLAAALKDDLHSFRGARNLLDHKARTKREETRRQRQFAERMLQGPRLAADLLSIKRRIT